MPRSVPIPLKSYRLTTDLSQAEVVARIEEWLQLRQSFLGKVSPKRFMLVRRIRYSNSFLPVIYGRFESGDRGCDVCYRATLHPLVLLFLALFGIQAATWLEIPPGVLLLIVSTLSAGALGSWIFEAPKVVGLLRECLETERLEVS